MKRSFAIRHSTFAIVTALTVSVSAAPQYTLADSATWAVPVILPDSLIVRDATGITKLVP